MYMTMDNYIHLEVYRTPSSIPPLPPLIKSLYYKTLSVRLLNCDCIEKVEESSTFYTHQPVHQRSRMIQHPGLLQHPGYLTFNGLVGVLTPYNLPSS